MRLTAGKVLLDQSMLASESGSPSKQGDPVSWSCRFVAGSGRAGHCDTGSAFVPPIASLIAAATADRSVLAIGHDFEVIPGVSSWKVSRQSSIWSQHTDNQADTSEITIGSTESIDQAHLSRIGARYEHNW